MISLTWISKSNKNEFYGVVKRWYVFLRVTKLQSVLHKMTLLIGKKIIFKLEN